MSITISRSDLYQRVWEEPIQKLSKEYGLSDVGLAKTCRRYNIPLPPRGYWAKKQAGKRVSTPALPPDAPKGYGGQIRFSGPSARPVERPEPVAPPPHPLIAAEADPANVIAVPEHLQIRHPLLRSTREFWRISKRLDFRWDVPIPPHLNIAVGKDTQPRALRLLQALFIALERRGHVVSAAEHGQIQITVLDEICLLSMRERQRQVRSEPAKGAAKSAVESRRPYELVHTGELELKVGRHFHERPFRETKGRPLETQLNAVVTCLLDAAFAEKEHRAEQARARLAEVERERLRAIAKQRAREERARVRRFEQLAAAAQRHQELVAFAAELRQAVGAVRPDSELDRWLAWIDRYVISTDVLSRFRTRQPTLTLYHCVPTYALDGVLQNGFVNRADDESDEKDLPASVALTDVPMEGIYGRTACVIIDVPDEDALPYEVIRGRHDYRSFRMPADVANRFARRSDAS